MQNLGGKEFNQYAVVSLDTVFGSVCTNLDLECLCECKSLVLLNLV